MNFLLDSSYEEQTRKDMARSKAQKDAERFVMMWERSSSREDAARRLGISVKYASQRASVFRGCGIDLKRWREGRPRKLEVDPSRFAHLNYDRLRSIVARERKEE